MEVQQADETMLAPRRGRLGQMLRRLLMRRATVTDAEWIADGFRLISFAGRDLAGVAWTPGQKLQIAIGAGLSTRTYTPIDWDAGSGRTRILGFLHGEGPGSDWLRTVAPGERCDLFGPRSSLDPLRLEGPLALFGDETAIGLGLAITGHEPSSSLTCHFEVADLEAGNRVVTALGLSEARLFARGADEAHVGQMEAVLPGLAAAGASFVLSGKAGTIQRLRLALKGLGVPAGRIATKAYWAPGKRGLD